MVTEKTHLKMRRFLQGPGCCALAAVAEVVNFYDKTCSYKKVCDIANPDGSGMYTPDIAHLLNKMGFKSVKVVSADIQCLDFKWKGLLKETLSEKLKDVGRRHVDEDCRCCARSYRKLLDKPGHKNELIIDRHFGDYIRSHLSAGKPVLASFNWNLFFEFPKWNEENKVDPVNGDVEQHQVVLNGFDNKGASVIDSHYQLYRGRLSKYKKGRYKIDWETLMTVIGFGDLILADNFEVK